MGLFPQKEISVNKPNVQHGPVFLLSSTYSSCSHSWLSCSVWPCLV